MTASQMVSVMCEENYNAVKAVENASESIAEAEELLENNEWSIRKAV